MHTSADGDITEDGSEELSVRSIGENKGEDGLADHNFGELPGTVAFFTTEGPHRKSLHEWETTNWLEDDAEKGDGDNTRIGEADHEFLVLDNFCEKDDQDKDEDRGDEIDQTRRNEKDENSNQNSDENAVAGECRSCRSSSGCRVLGLDEETWRGGGGTLEVKHDKDDHEHSCEREEELGRGKHLIFVFENFCLDIFV